MQLLQSIFSESPTSTKNCWPWKDSRWRFAQSFHCYLLVSTTGNLKHEAVCPSGAIRCNWEQWNQAFYLPVKRSHKRYVPSHWTGYVGENSQENYRSEICWLVVWWRHRYCRNGAVHNFDPVCWSRSSITGDKILLSRECSWKVQQHWCRNSA